MAFIIYVGFLLFAVFGRIALHYRQLGDSGVRMVSRDAPFVMRLASLLLIISSSATFLLVTLDFIGLLHQDDVLSHWVVAQWGKGATQVGMGFALLGMFVTVVSQLQMGRHWRIGVDENETTGLVTTGIYHYVRNPIYTGVMLFGFGIALMLPGIPMTIGMALGLVAIIIQVRCVEEPHLYRLHGARFREYVRSTGRYWPRLKA